MRDRLLHAAVSLALCAIVCYIALAALPLLTPEYNTAVLKREGLSESVAVYGVFFREELVLPASDVFIERIEGERIAAGGDLAEGLKAPVGGIFTAHLDGFEHLSRPKSLDAQSILSLTGDRRIAVSSPGKLITGSQWSFYAVLETAEAQKLTPGTTCTLESEYWGGIELTVSELGEPWQDFTAAIFTGNSGMDTVMYLREISAELLLGEHSGLRIPLEALNSDENGYYVQVLTLGRLERAPVEVLYTGDSFILASSPMLWEGSEIILNNTNLEAIK